MILLILIMAHLNIMLTDVDLQWSASQDLATFFGPLCYNPYWANMVAGVNTMVPYSVAMPHMTCLEDPFNISIEDVPPQGLFKPFIYPQRYVSFFLRILY
jgi:hypothetical protein